MAANIWFTTEAESYHKLPFLDTHIDNTGPALVTRLFRKKTFTGLLTSFSSFISFSYKTGLVKTLVDRTLRICNTWQAFNEDIKYLTTILKKNLYPYRLIERIIYCSVTKHVTSNSGKLPVNNRLIPFISNYLVQVTFPASPKSAFVDFLNSTATM